MYLRSCSDPSVKISTTAVLITLAMVLDTLPKASIYFPVSCDYSEDYSELEVSLEAFLLAVSNNAANPYK